MGKRIERAVTALAVDLAVRLTALGVSSGQVSLEQTTDAVRPIAIMLADAERAADRALKRRDDRRRLAARLLDRAAHTLAEPCQRSFVPFDPDEWVPARAAPGDAVLASVSMSGSLS